MDKCQRADASTAYSCLRLFCCGPGNSDCTRTEETTTTTKPKQKAAAFLQVLLGVRCCSQHSCSVSQQIVLQLSPSLTRTHLFASIKMVIHMCCWFFLFTAVQIYFGDRICLLVAEMPAGLKSNPFSRRANSFICLSNLG